MIYLLVELEPPELDPELLELELLLLLPPPVLRVEEPELRDGEL